MPWKAATVTEQRVRFIRDHDRYVKTGKMTMSRLCREHGIERKTGYKFVARHRDHGWQGLVDLARAPHTGPHWTALAIRNAIVQVRQEYPEWGAKKIVAYLGDFEPDTVWPAASTAHEILRRAGLVEPRSRNRRYPHPGRPNEVVPTGPNQLWTADFKGHFRTRDRRYCYPLTVADSYSRYILGCQALRANTLELTWPVFDRLFREYGLPDAILTDNGSPFASTSLARLSKLSVRWVRLGIMPQLIDPGKPQQNGRHERMHRTLKEQACSEPSMNCREHQKQFDRFVVRFNSVRPHESLGQKPPAKLYTPSLRAYPRRIPEIEYPSGLSVRRVRSTGEIKWKGQWFYVSNALAGEPIAFEPVADGIWIVSFGPLDLGYFSERERKLLLDRNRPDGKVENALRFPLSHRPHH